MTYLSSRETFDRKLQEMLEQVLILGSMVEAAIQQSMRALQQHDRKAARRIYMADIKINEKRYAIENQCVALIATQQPMARDVRFLTAVFEIITELERMGDYAKGISKITMQLSEERNELDMFLDLQRMSDLGLNMLRRVLDAFVTQDLETARAIPKDDDTVDDLYNKINNELIRRVIADANTVEYANLLLWAAHNLERMADRVINICERIVYVATGEMIELDLSEGFLTGFKNEEKQ